MLERMVVLINQNGFYFGPSCSISVGGFVAASAAVLPASAPVGGMWNYQGPPPAANIINYGEIKAHSGGSLFLIAEGIENHGLLSAPDGKISLYAGKEVQLSQRADGRGLSASVSLPEGTIDNSGRIIADAGTIALHARTVNQDGLIQANTIRNQNGVVELLASDAIVLGANSILRANGGEAVGNAGNITVQAGNSLLDHSGSRLEVRGGDLGGNGGWAELSAPTMPAILSVVDGTAIRGIGGQLLIDPQNIVLNGTGTGSAGTGTVPVDAPPASGTLNLNVNSAFLGLSQIDLQARGNITLAANTTWELGLSTGISAPGSHLVLEAGNNITLQANSELSGGPGWSISLQAGRNFNTADSFQSGVGVITLQAGSKLQVQDGALSLIAGKDVTFLSGLVSSTGGSIDVQARSGNINIGNSTSASGVQWALDSLPDSTSSASLTLSAANNILFANSSSILAHDGWSLNLAAGVDFSSPNLPTRIGIGGIYLNGGVGPAFQNDGALATTDGDINLRAGKEVIVSGGYIRTEGGGNISIATGSGDINSGIKPDTYDFTSDGYVISQLGLGGIGTEHGGNVTMQAGGNIVAAAAPIGAFGSELGNLRVTAAGDILGGYMVASTGVGTGSFVVRNGVGTLNAGRDIGDSGSSVSFGLIAGGWNLNAARDVYIDEIYNPNGCLNGNRMSFGPRITYQFDYDANAFVNIAGGNSVQLLGNNLAGHAANPARRPIYAPILNVLAGPHGIELGNEVVLYPSAQGSLIMNTVASGPLSSLPGQFYPIVVSDSDSPDFNTFDSAHGSVPLHLGGTGAGTHLDIAGNLENVFLRTAEAADIRIRGNAINFGLEAQNLSADDVTTVRIDGDFFSRSDRTFVTLSDAPNLSVLTDPAISTLLELGNRITYNSVTHVLGIQNTVTAADLDNLLHPTVYVLDPVTLTRELDPLGNPRVVPAQFTSDSTALQSLFDHSQDIPTSSLARNGIQVGGAGKLNVFAHNLDLGISQGIRSIGSLLNPALAQISPSGVDINVTATGNILLTSSSISSFSGGSLAINSLGKIDVGSQESFTSDDTPKGIYTGHGGSVNVHAFSDINIEGSRIASYDGGDVSVVSETGTVDAGAGAKGFFSITFSTLNPLTGLVETRNERFFGSGIMSTTGTDSDGRVGNINVSAGQDIVANSGGILQLAFNHADQSSATVSLNAGRDISANNSGVLGANIDLKAGGSISGLIVATHDINIQAQQNVSVTAIAGGTANVSAGANVTGSIVGAGAVNVAGGEITASVISASGNTSTSGNSSGASIGAFASAAAPAAQKTTEDADKTVASKSLAQGEDEDEKKKRAAAKGPTLLRRIGRVTVILPKA